VASITEMAISHGLKRGTQSIGPAPPGDGLRPEVPPSSAAM